MFKEIQQRTKYSANTASYIGVQCHLTTFVEILTFDGILVQFKIDTVKVPLINTQIKEAKPRDKDYKLSDGGGMYLLVKKNGHKYWRIDYHFRGKRKTLSLGVYPEIMLKAAREKRSQVKRLLEQNIDPSETRKEEKRKQDIILFEEVAKQWREHQRQTWIEDHAKLPPTIFSTSSCFDLLVQPVINF